MSEQKQRIIAYFRSLDRASFMEHSTEKAFHDEPLPIGFGQTISQPSLVLEMTLALDVQPHHKVLEIGTGSGFQTALLAAFSQEVYTVEKIAELSQLAQQRLSNKSFHNIHFLIGDGSLGWRDQVPFDRIMVTAAALEIPQELLDQLAPDGRMIIPVGSRFRQELLAIDKPLAGPVTKTVLEAVRFVPLKGKYEH